MSENLQFAIVIFLMLTVIFGFVLYIVENPRKKPDGVWIWDGQHGNYEVFRDEIKAYHYSDKMGYGDVYFMAFDETDWED